MSGFKENYKDPYSNKDEDPNDWPETLISGPDDHLSLHERNDVLAGSILPQFQELVDQDILPMEIAVHLSNIIEYIGAIESSVHKAYEQIRTNIIKSHKNQVLTESEKKNLEVQLEINQTLISNTEIEALIKRLESYYNVFKVPENVGDAMLEAIKFAYYLGKNPDFIIQRDILKLYTNYELNNKGETRSEIFLYSMSIVASATLSILNYSTFEDSANPIFLEFSTFLTNLGIALTAIGLSYPLTKRLLPVLNLLRYGKLLSPKDEVEVFKEGKLFISIKTFLKASVAHEYDYFQKGKQNERIRSLVNRDFIWGVTGGLIIFFTLLFPLLTPQESRELNAQISDIITQFQDDWFNEQPTENLLDGGINFSLEQTEATVVAEGEVIGNFEGLRFHTVTRRQQISVNGSLTGSLLGVKSIEQKELGSSYIAYSAEVNGHRDEYYILPYDEDTGVAKVEAYIEGRRLDEGAIEVFYNESNGSYYTRISETPPPGSSLEIKWYVDQPSAREVTGVIAELEGIPLSAEEVMSNEVANTIVNRIQEEYGEIHIDELGEIIRAGNYSLDPLRNQLLNQGPTIRDINKFLDRAFRSDGLSCVPANMLHALYKAALLRQNGASPEEILDALSINIGYLANFETDEDGNVRVVIANPGHAWSTNGDFTPMIVVEDDYYTLGLLDRWEDYAGTVGLREKNVEVQQDFIESVLNNIQDGSDKLFPLVALLASVYLGGRILNRNKKSELTDDANEEKENNEPLKPEIKMPMTIGDSVEEDDLKVLQVLANNIKGSHIVPYYEMHWDVARKLGNIFNAKPEEISALLKAMPPNREVEYADLNKIQKEKYRKLRLKYDNYMKKMQEAFDRRDELKREF